MDMQFLAKSKRAVKAVRNLINDPLPRSNVLLLKSIVQSGETVTFNYLAKGDEYAIKLHLTPVLSEKLQTFEDSIALQALTAIGIAFSPFFFKLTDFEAVKVETAPLDYESKKFFEKFLLGGLGEFRYLQGLDPTRKIAVIADDKDIVLPIEILTDDRVMMLNGGGKDTAVAAELLAHSAQTFSWLTVGSNDTRRKIIELSGVSDAINVRYALDPKIKSNQVYGWGHTPYVSIFMSIGLLIALLTNTRYVATGSELSANYGNVRYRGVDVNHQYTKSFVYEQGFSDFVRRRITPSVEVFSILRPFHDLQLAEIFATKRQYHSHFVSCNRGISKGVWCKDCPKCAFTALAIAPFLDQGSITVIFGEDVFRRPAIRKHIVSLVSGAIKPWECVGTRDECGLALSLLLEKYPNMDFDEHPRRYDLEQLLRNFDITALRRDILDATAAQHSIPPAIAAKLNIGLDALSHGRLQFTS